MKFEWVFIVGDSRYDRRAILGKGNWRTSDRAIKVVGKAVISGKIWRLWGIIWHYDRSLGKGSI